MESSQRILERLPSFYKTWNPDALLYKVVCSFGKRLDEAEKDLYAILRAHWVDKALRPALDNLGALYNLKRSLNETDSQYRNRLKLAIMEYKGGGTINAITTAVNTVLGRPRESHLELVENPRKECYKDVLVRTGDTWWQSSQSVLDATPSLEITVETPNGKVTNPTISNVDLNESVSFQGTLQSGDQLRIEGEQATLNGEDVTSQLAPATIPTLSRQGSTWRYVERLEKEIGVFNSSRFDESMFPVGIATIKLRFHWVAYQPATFEIRVPHDIMSRRDDVLRITEAVNSIKAAGVRAFIQVVGV